MKKAKKNPYILIAFLLLSSVTASSQDKPFVSYPENISNYLKRIQKGDQKYKYTKDKNFKDWQNETRAALIELIGLKKMSIELKDHVPSIQIGQQEEVNGKFSRTLCKIETEPGVNVPFYLLVPSNTNKKLPLVICPHGHDTEGLHSYSGAYLNEDHRKKITAREGNIAEQAALRGMIAIAPATRGLANEVLVPDPKGRHGNRPCRAQFMHCIISGRTPTAERVWDMQRIIDWAWNHPRVDQKKIIMTGNSGGGVLTAYATAIDNRISIAVPSCSFTSVTSSEGFIFHCDCCAVPGIRDWGDWTELGALIAPRNLLIVHGVSDGLHRKKDVESTSTKIKNVYLGLGIGNKMEMEWGNSGHRFYPSIMWPFIEKAIGTRR
ncbi:MAG: alpha/beta hydrolase family protein [Verrucomicrobiales bacterium]|nr:alpha/beta hydrolase family protein [Verrucomicrobiales bacterium]